MSDAMVADPFGNHFFKLEIDSEEVAHLVEVSGLKTSAKVFEIEEGGINGHVHKRVGGSRWENLVLRYATNSSSFMQEWRDTFLSDPFNSDLWRSGSIVMFDNDGQAIRRFHFTRAWPVSWEGPSLDSMASELAIEAIEIAHEGIRITDR